MMFLICIKIIIFVTISLSSWSTFKLFYCCHFCCDNRDDDGFLPFHGTFILFVFLIKWLHLKCRRFKRFLWNWHLMGSVLDNFCGRCRCCSIGQNKHKRHLFIHLCILQFCSSCLRCCDSDYKKIEWKKLKRVVLSAL